MSAKGEAGVPRTRRGWETRRKLLAAAEEVFGRDGYHKAAVFDITRQAGVGQGTFYLYFPSKQAVFVELVHEMGHDMRSTLRLATSGLPDRAAVEEEGLRAFFDFVARHPSLYRILRESEHVAPEAHRDWYERLAEGYVAGIRDAVKEGGLRGVDPELAAYVLMSIGDFMGMWLLRWKGLRRVPDEMVAGIADIVLRGLLPR